MKASVVKEVKELLGKADAIGAKAESEERDLTTAERTEITDLFEKAKSKRSDATLLGDLTKFAGEMEAKDVGDADPIADLDGSLGDRFVKSEAWQAFQKSHPSGFEGKKGIQSPPVGFKGFKDLVTGASATSAGALVETDVRGLLDQGAYARPLTVLDLITRGSTLSDLIEYVRVTTTTNAAAAVPEATISSVIPDPDNDNTAGLKPESAVALERVQAPVVTIAHWIPATKRALSDAAQIRTLIDGFLRYGLNEELEDQIVSGTGGDGFTGILSTSGRQTQAWDGTKFSDDRDILVTTRKAKTKVTVVGRAMPTAYLFNPNDAERLDLLTDGNGQFYFGGPAVDGAQRLWRLPVVTSEAIAEGTGLVGDFRQAVLWDREQASISASDSHQDFFTRNLVAILAELRAAFGILRPSAFVEIDLTSGS